VLLISGSAKLGAQTAREEAVVRATYARLSSAVDVNTAYMAAKSNRLVTAADLSSKIAAAGLRFELSDFKFGSLDDSDVVEVVDKDFPGMVPDGQKIIQTTVATLVTTETTDAGKPGTPVSSVTATAFWSEPPHGTAPGWPMRDLRSVLEQELGVKPLLRYCTYTVKVTLAGKTKTYKAAFFFGENDKPAPSDTVVGIGGGALAYFASHPLVPDILSKTRFDKNPAVHNFTAAVAQ
jgi:hypothetical protein